MGGRFGKYGDAMRRDERMRQIPDQAGDSGML